MNAECCGNIVIVTNPKTGRDDTELFVPYSAAVQSQIDLKQWFSGDWIKNRNEIHAKVMQEDTQLQQQIQQTKALDEQLLKLGQQHESLMKQMKQKTYFCSVCRFQSPPVYTPVQSYTKCNAHARY